MTLEHTVYALEKCGVKERSLLQCYLRRTAFILELVCSFRRQKYEK